jgi:hypothetical protein
MRATMSEEAPGVKPTTTWIGRVGKGCCAKARGGDNIAAKARSDIVRRSM